MEKRKVQTLSLAFLLISTMLACNFIMPQVTPEPTVVPGLTTIVESTSLPQNNLPRDENAVPRVSLEQALAALNSGAAIFVDVRSAEAYQAKHIKGAISIPLGEIESNPTGLNLEKDQWIITYCT